MENSKNLKITAYYEMWNGAKQNMKVNEALIINIKIIAKCYHVWETKRILKELVFIGI